MSDKPDPACNNPYTYQPALTEEQKARGDVGFRGPVDPDYEASLEKAKASYSDAPVAASSEPTIVVDPMPIADPAPIETTPES